MKKFFLLLALGLVLVVPQVNAAPSLINYQGVLTDAGGVAVTNAAQAMTFRLYDAESSGNLLWEENQTVAVSNGSYNLLLGSITPLDPALLAGDNVWLEIAVAGETFGQRQRLVSVPYAIQAGSLSSGVVPCNPGDFINCYTGTPGTMGVGVCSPGTRTCDPQGVWGSCSGETLPATEICDGIDNNCDGQVDEGCAFANVIAVSYGTTMPGYLTVQFSQEIDSNSVFPDGSQFTFSNGLVANAAQVQAGGIVLVGFATTPTNGGSYDLTVAPSVTNLSGIPISANSFPWTFTVIWTDGTPCDDGNICTSGDVIQGGVCVGGAPLNCDDGNPWTNDFCDPAVGCQSVPVPDGTPCDDGNLCTTNDTVQGGTCVGGAPLSCDDGVACTQDSCDPVQGCQSIPNNTFCDDGNLLTVDSCDPAVGCQSVPVPDGTPCDDGDGCTFDDQVLNGVCIGTAVTCNDGIACTQDICSPTSSTTYTCIYTVNPGSCQIGGTCYQSGAANPANPCQSCNDSVSQTSWAYEPAGMVCGLGDLCTGNDFCDGAGLCVGGAPVNCDDGNECTADSCDIAAGCLHTPVVDGTSCSAGICQSGLCQ